MDPRATVMSIDGISAYDLISRQAMLQGLHDVPGGSSALPFVSMFYGSASSYLWEDAHGHVHTIVQGEGGEQGDAMMPLVFSLGQHKALVRAQSQMAPGEVLLAFLDDVHTVSPPGRVSTVHSVLDEALWSEAGIRIHQGKTQIWNQAGEKPEGCEELERVAVAADPTAVVWPGSDELPSHKRGMKVLGTPLGHADFIRDHLEKTAAEHQVLLDRIPLVDDVQSAWLLLVHCAAARANYLCRVVEPATVVDFCRTHDERLWRCLCSTVQMPPEQPEEVVQAATMPLVLGGVGLRSASRVSEPACWASWADSLSVIRSRHPEVAHQLVEELDGFPTTPFLRAAADAKRNLTGSMGFEPPSWEAVAAGGASTTARTRGLRAGNCASGVAARSQFSQGTALQR